MSIRVRRAAGVLALLLLALAARGPLHRATFDLPVSNDDAIPLLMARALLRGEWSTTLWNQPYNGALDAYLLAPLVALLGAHNAFRLYQATCAVLLVIAAFFLARRLAGEAAGWAAAALAAIGTPYMALMTAIGPTPNFLVPLLTALPALFLPAGPVVSLLVGLACGLAVWDTALAIPALAGIGIGLLLAHRAAAVRSGAFAVLGVVCGAVPLLIARQVGATGASAVTALRPRWLWLDGLRDLAHAAAGLLGLDVALVVDGPERWPLPLVMRLLLGASLLLLIVRGLRSRASWPLAGWVLLLCAAFAFSRRTGPDEIRYLYGLVLPLLAVAGAGLGSGLAACRVQEARRDPGVLAGLAAGLVICGTWIWGSQVVARHWSDPAHAVKVWQVPPLEPVLQTLRRAGVRSAYASLQFAGRLTLESDDAVIASQAWNERIPGDPLRFRDEVDLDPRAAWVLSPGLSRGMPRAGGLRQWLQASGAAWNEDLPGDMAVFRSFRPPYDETRPLEISSVATLDGVILPASALDRDPSTQWTASQGITRGSGLEVTLTATQRIAALVLLVDLIDTPLAVPWICEAEGAIVARGPDRAVLQWVNGAPRAGRQAQLTVLTGGVTTSRLRLVFQGSGPVLRVNDVMAYGPDAPALPASGAAAAERALDGARAGDWDAALTGYAEAVRLEPHRAGYHACLARARWRAAQRRRLDVESLDDGGPSLVGSP